MPYIDTGRVSVFCEETGSGDVPVLLLHKLVGSREREAIPSLATNTG
jgi:hypothetical protein